MGYTKGVYDKAFAELDRRKREARERAQAHRAEIYERIPQVRELDRRISATAAAVARTVLANPDRAGELVEELGRENLAAQEERVRLLEEQGYPADYLRERPACERCRDTGYEGTAMCACLRELLRREAYAQLSQVSQAGECSFDSFRLDYYPDQAVDQSGVVPRARMGEVLEACRQYAAGFHPHAESLLMLGQTGLGKTHLSLSIAREATGAGFGVVYTPAQRLMDRLESEKFSRGQERTQYQDSMRHVLECDLLVLDDLGTEFATSFTASALYNIINSRLVEQRPTVISTNLDLPAIEERYTQRMVSRLICGYKVLKFYGKDVRYMKKMQSLR